MNSGIFTVSELNSLIKDVVSSGFPSSLWVCGEIQNLDRYKSKAHLFFDLVEKNPSANDIKAKLGVTIWSGVRPRIEALLKKAENAFELKDGIEVKFSGKVDFYPPYGTLRFVIDGIDPVYTLGKIAQDRQRLIAELAQTGVLAKNKELALSPLPLRLGLLSSFDSAAYNDFIAELKKSGFAFQVYFVNTIMQGKNCEASVCAGLTRLNRLKGLDAIILTRGGGSIAELSAFDSKDMAITIARSSYPVITGIGHEINTSVADMAAHTFAKTPTAVAQLLAETVRQALETLEARHIQLLDMARMAVEHEGADLRDRAIKLQNLTRDLLQSRKDQHVRLIQRVGQLPRHYCAQSRQDLHKTTEELLRASQLRFKSADLKITATEKLIRMAAPERILKRGFSITRLASGRLLRSQRQVAPADELITELVDGKIKSLVK